MGEFEILGVGEFSCVTSGLLEENNIGLSQWIYCHGFISNGKYYIC